jgi:hypothetical protein
MAVSNSNIGSSSDDADQQEGGFGFDSDENTVVVVSGDHYWRKVTGLRFTGVDVEPEATISDARLQFKCRTGYLDVEMRIYYQPLGEARLATFSDTETLDVVTRDKSSSYVSWSGSADPSTKIATSPDISSIVQEMVDSEYWQGEGEGTVVLLLYGKPLPAQPDHVKTKFVAYDDDTSKCAKLIITHT